jgi:hypothetical protein
MGAVKVEFEHLSATLKNEAHAECIAAFHKVTDYAQPYPGAPVRIPIGDIGGSDRLEHSRQTSVREAAQTTTKSRQGCRFHSRSESIPKTARTPPDRLAAFEARRIRLPAASISATVTPYSAAAYSESGSATAKGIALRLTT